MNESTATLHQTLGQQIFHIGNQIEQVANTLRSSLPQAPYIIETLQNLSEQIRTIGHKVSQNDSERVDLLALADIGQVVNSSLKLNDVLRIVMDTIIRITGAERGFLMLRDEDGGLSIRIARNWEQESIQPSDFAISRTIVNRVIDEGIPIVTTNAQEDPRFDGQASIIAYNLRSILCVPLKVKGKLTGVIYADNRIRAGIFTENERDLLAAFANQAAVAIDNAQLFESVQRTLAEVTELKNMMDNIFASIASGVITADIQEKITLCNQAAEQILGQSADHLVGQPLGECLPPVAIELVNPMKAVLNTNHPVLGYEVSPELPNRGQVDLVFNLSPLKDARQDTQGIAIVVDDHTERKRLESQRRLFERMVPPAVIDQIDLDKLQLGGERAAITTLFADVRGFTSFSETLAPEQLVSILNRYLAAAADAVLAQEGTLDKFMGDAVMAIFNAPIPQPDHTLRAVRAALGMQTAIQAVHSQLPMEFQLEFGIGIHFGDAVLGLVGTEKRVDYTAIGDSVNTAKRIQENAARGQILISKAAYEHVHQAVIAKPCQPIFAKGKKEPIEVFQIFNTR
jgi:PAS domain S-box-containing protein